MSDDNTWTARATDKARKADEFGDTDEQGLFAGDKDMPHFSLEEGAAACQYLLYAIAAKEARRARLKTVIMGYDDYPLEEVERRRDRYFTEFMEAVRIETLRSQPQATEEDIRSRAHDILACHQDTGYKKEVSASQPFGGAFRR